MLPSRPALSSVFCRPRPGRVSGFTVVEALLALLAVGLAATIAVGEVRKFRHREQVEKVIAELRTLATAFETYRLQNGEWPAATHAEARVPRGMEAALAKTPWLVGPPCGGSYDWLPPAKVKAEEKTKPEEKEAVKPAAVGGVIAITAFSTGPELNLSDEDLRAIDAALDDGNLATGRLRTGFNRWPIYQVALKR